MLTRAPIQSAASLQATYENFLTKGGMATYARQMLAILPGLERLCAGLSVQGLTSHARLRLALTDTQGASPVLITPLGSKGYMIEDGVVPSMGGATEFTQRGFAATPNEALALIAVAIERSGWGRRPASPSAG